jgi:hypothetical protein
MGLVVSRARGGFPARVSASRKPACFVRSNRRILLEEVVFSRVALGPAFFVLRAAIGVLASGRKGA